jgi:Icc-related predicted phosphoesterase
MVFLPDGVSDDADSDDDDADQNADNATNYTSNAGILDGPEFSQTDNDESANVGVATEDAEFSIGTLFPNFEFTDDDLLDDTEDPGEMPLFDDPSQTDEALQPIIEDDEPSDSDDVPPDTVNRPLDEDDTATGGDDPDPADVLEPIIEDDTSSSGPEIQPLSDGQTIITEDAADEPAAQLNILTLTSEQMVPVEDTQDAAELAILEDDTAESDPVVVVDGTDDAGDVVDIGDSDAADEADEADEVDEVDESAVETIELAGAFEPVTITDFDPENDVLEIVMSGGSPDAEHIVEISLSDDDADTYVMVDGSVAAILVGVSGIDLSHISVI